MRISIVVDLGEDFEFADDEHREQLRKAAVEFGTWAIHDYLAVGDSAGKQSCGATFSDECPGCGSADGCACGWAEGEG